MPFDQASSGQTTTDQPTTAAPPSTTAPPSTFDPPTTGAVAELNLFTVGTSPAVSVSQLYLTTSTALGNAALQATANMQKGFEVSQTATLLGIQALYQDVRAARLEALKILEDNKTFS